MASSSAPTTPNVRRSFSLPVSRLPSTPDPQIEILYTLPSARIIAFTTSNPSSRPSSSNGILPVEEEPGTLPWVSRFERTIAVGALRIYRAPGSVAFLNCANALQPILPKSQAWCVDGDSKFVLQIRPPQYWRIEVPNKSSEEILRVEDLKKVLEHVLRFEKTPCPFQRDFTVELPEPPQTPIKKMPWKPIERASIEISPLLERSTTVHQSIGIEALDPEPSPILTRQDSDSLTLETKRASTLPELPQSPLIKVATKSQPSVQELRTVFTLPSENRPDPFQEPLVEEDIDIHDLADPIESLPLRSPVRRPTLEEFPGFGEDSDSFSDATDDTNATPKSHYQPAFQPLIFDSEKDERPPALQNCNRSVTAPPVLSLITSPPSKHMKMESKSPVGRSPLGGPGSDFSSSVDSFHTVQSWHSPLAPPSPPTSGPSSPTAYPYPHDNIVLPKNSHHGQEISEFTITPETPNAWDSAAMSPQLLDRSSSPPPNTSIIAAGSSKEPSNDPSETPTQATTKSTIRHRATTSSNSRRRALSPMPPAVNLFNPPARRPRRLQTSRHLPTAIIQKTCEILLSPPSHLFHLMMSIASRIAAGEWRGVLSGYGEAVHWDFEDEYGRDGWFEDDYGVSLPHPPQSSRSRGNSGTSSGGSWEVD